MKSQEESKLSSSNCVKFCYWITINLNIQNCVSSFCVAKFLRMTEAVDSGNFVMKLEGKEKEKFRAKREIDRDRGNHVKWSLIWIFNGQSDKKKLGYMMGPPKWWVLNARRYIRILQNTKKRKPKKSFWYGKIISFLIFFYGSFISPVCPCH